MTDTDVTTGAGLMNGARTRPATADDLAFIYDAERAYMQAIEPASEPGWLRARDRNVALWQANLDRTFILELDGAVAGYVMWMGSGDLATLITINVSPDHRQRGLGAVLMDKFVTDAAEHGYTELRLGAHKLNLARKLYLNAGFDHVGDEEDYLLYARSLSDTAG